MALAPGSGGRRKERLLLKEKCSWLSHQRAPLGERASSSCMGNGQLIHLEIDSGCGAPQELGGGTWSRAGCWRDMGQAAEERGMLLSGVRLRSRWSLRSRGLVCLLLSVLPKRGAAPVISFILFLECLLSRQVWASSVPENHSPMPWDAIQPSSPPKLQIHPAGLWSRSFFGCQLKYHLLSERPFLTNRSRSPPHPLHILCPITRSYHLHKTEQHLK